MSFRTRMIVFVAVVLTAVGTWASAQALLPRSTQPVDPPIVLSGNDVGFRVTGRQGDTPVGSLMVRVDGKWVPVRFGGSLALVP